jgi:hypothetical protein
VHRRIAKRTDESAQNMGWIPGNLGMVLVPHMNGNWQSHSFPVRFFKKLKFSVWISNIQTRFWFGLSLIGLIGFRVTYILKLLHGLIVR